VDVKTCELELYCSEKMIKSILEDNNNLHPLHGLGAGAYIRQILHHIIFGLVNNIRGSFGIN